MKKRSAAPTRDIVAVDSRYYGNVEGDQQLESIGGCMSYVLVVAAWLVFVCTLPFSLYFCLKVIKEYERAVFFRLGRLTPGGARYVIDAIKIA